MSNTKQDIIEICTIFTIISSSEILTCSILIYSSGQFCKLNLEIKHKMPAFISKFKIKAIVCSFQQFKCSFQEMANETQGSDSISLEEANNLSMRSNIVVIVYISLAVLLGVIGNSLTFIYHGFIEKRKSVTTFLITVLAINDLMTSIVLSDHIIIMRFLIVYESKLGCQITYFLNNFFVTNSLVFLAPIATERCLRVCTNNPKYHMTKRKSIVALSAIAFYSLCISFRHVGVTGVLSFDVQVSENETVVGHICSFLRDEDILPVVEIFNIIDIMSFSVTNITLLIMYSIMAKKIGLVRRKINAYPAPTSKESLSLKTPLSQSNLAYETPSTSASNGAVSTVANKYNYGENAAKFTNNINEKSKCALSSTENHLTVDSLKDFTSNRFCFKDSASNYDNENKSFADKTISNTNVSMRQNLFKIKPPDNVFDGAEDSVDSTETKNALSENMRVKRSNGKKQVSRRTRRHETAERKITLMLGMVTLASVLIFVPYFYVVIVIRPEITPGKFTYNAPVQLAWKSFLLNSTINPYIIGVFNSKFRKFVINLICCCKSFSKTS